MSAANVANMLSDSDNDDFEDDIDEKFFPGSDDECGCYEEVVGEESDDDERENVDDLDSNNGNR